MDVKVKFSSQNPNTKEMANTYFAEDGGWEKNGGRLQTRRFARCFVRNFSIPLEGEFSFLDLGCALGDALPVIREQNPKASLFGTDFSEVAIERCRERFGSIASFFVSSLDDFDKYFDVILLSNVVEHIENSVEIVGSLSEYCKILYILTPYNEHVDGRRITPEIGYHHVATMDEHSFDPLLSNPSLHISHKIFKCAGAWDYSLKKKISSALLFKKLEPRLQIGYEIINDNPSKGRR